MQSTPSSSPAPTPVKAAKPTKAAKAPKPRMSLSEAMATLEAAGSAQTRKTYARHGAPEPMFGVSFATLKDMLKRIGVDHELACALWDTGNFDARNLAVKIVDPSRMSPADLDRWALESSASRACGGYAAMLAAEGPHGLEKAELWLSATDESLRTGAWTLVGQLASRDEVAPDAWFEARLSEIERTIRAVPNREREVMNGAVIAIGGRSAALREAAVATARRLGKIEIDHGDTDCKTPDAVAYIEKTWANAVAKGATSPAAQERERGRPRLRC